MKKTAAIIILSVLLTVALATSCSQDVVAVDSAGAAKLIKLKITIFDTSDNNGKALAAKAGNDDSAAVKDMVEDNTTLPVYVYNNISRIRLLAVCTSNYAAYGSSNSWRDLDLKSTEYEILIENGTWRFSVRAYDEGGNVVYSNDMENVVVDDEVTEVEVQLEPAEDLKDAFVRFDIAAPYTQDPELDVYYRLVDDEEWTLVEDTRFFRVYLNQKENAENANGWVEFVNDGSSSAHLLSLPDGTYVFRFEYFNAGVRYSSGETPAQTVSKNQVVTISGHFDEDIFENENAGFVCNITIQLMAREIFVSIDGASDTRYFFANIANSELTDISYFWYVDGEFTGTTTRRLTYAPESTGVHTISCIVTGYVSDVLIMGSANLEIEYTEDDLRYIGIL